MPTMDLYVALFFSFSCIPIPSNLPALVTLIVEASPGNVVDEFVVVTLVCQSSPGYVSGLEEFVWLKQTSPSTPAELVQESSRIGITFEEDPVPTSVLTFTPAQIGDTATYFCRSGPTLEANITLTVQGKKK